MDTFDDLGINAELAAGAEALGWEAPTGLQKHATPVIRRGNNAILHASTGSGEVAAYGLGILDRLLAEQKGESPRALVLLPDARAVSTVADALARLALPVHVSVGAIAPGWRSEGDVLVATPASALARVRRSELKLGALDALVVDGADLMSETWPHVEPLLEAVPSSAQRVLVTGRFTPELEAFAEGHVRKAMTIPSRAVPGLPDDAPEVEYTVGDEGDKAASVVHFLGGRTGEVAVVCRTVDRAEAANLALAARGVGVDGEGDPRVVVLPRLEADRRSTRAYVVSWDVPFDADEMAALHGKGGAAVVTPRERAHLVRIAARAGLRSKAVAVPEAAESAADVLRRRIRTMTEEDLAPELALVEPLLEEIPGALVAAAAVRLAGGPREATATETLAGEAPAGAAPAPSGDPWATLFFSVGRRDQAGPGDIVGAITGESGVSGDKVGRIEISESHTTVQVATDVAGRVISALNGRTLRGRSLRVDYDRKGRPRS